MAHNNGMMPRSTKGGRGKGRGFSDNAAKFRAAADVMPIEPAGTAYDPGPPDLDQINAVIAQSGIGNLPLHGATGAEIAGFVPHRPVRPEKSEGGKRFELVSEYEPAGDQPTAIRELVAGIQGLSAARPEEETSTIVTPHGTISQGERDQVLLGVTGSGKTFTMAKVIATLQRPALILAPNKTLAAQLYAEMKSFFPNNAVEYFVSYYDYYQPEAYIPRTDTYIEKDSSINEEIDRMRHAATRAILERDDVIIVASVSCIYGIGSVETYSGMALSIARGQRWDRMDLMRQNH